MTWTNKTTGYEVQVIRSTKSEVVVLNNGVRQTFGLKWFLEHMAPKN